MSERRADRLDELLVARATQALTAAETKELERLLAARPDVDAESYERAAAAVCLAALRAPSEMPGSLRRGLARAADSLFAESRRPRP
jgi:hypothetical protein